MPRGRILAVDDQRYFRELIEVLLVEEGFEVQTCASGEEALRLLDHAVFDVIVTDLVMPAMTGIDLVQRVKERDPEQEIIVVTGVVDVQSAVDAMKVGATDYLLKPFDRATLSSALEGILQRARLRQERDRLLAENIEFLGERALFERAIALFRATTLEALSEKVLDGVCRETGAQGGVLWWQAEDAPAELRLLVAHGLVRLEEERAQLGAGELPQALRETGATTALVDWSDPNGLPRPALVVALRRGGALVGLFRLTDKLGGELFDDVDRACAEKFLSFADAAYRNVERFQRLERRTLQDPDTGAYRIEYLHDVVRNEIEKANRFGRSFSLVSLAIEPLAPLRKRLDDQAFRNWHGSLARYLARQLRATDLLAVEGEGQFCLLLVETAAVGAATFKQRTRLALGRGEPLAAVKAALRPEVIAGSVSYPGDATQHEALLRLLERRLGEDRRARERERRLAALPIGDALTRLIESGEGEPAPAVASLFQFAISEVGRRPRERNLMFCRPGALFADALAEGLRRRPDAACETELVVLADPLGVGMAEQGVTWLPADAVAGPPFAVHFGDGPSYVLVADVNGEPGHVRWFHSADRSLAESLAFRLQRELRVPRLS
ncbi:MAG: response regulator [Deltaproteobacteria bacterium]|nr:MAG: response regulator [Deltaproteobacteria bacterium]